MSGVPLDEPRPPSWLRLAVCVAAVAAALPYLVLKVIWLSGSTVGITDPAFAADPSMAALNLFTLLMDVAAIALVLAFTFRWGLRVPAGVVLFPVWVGTGFLTPIVLAIPVAGLAAGLTGERADASSGGLPLAGWVIPLVYGGFMLLGVMLLIAFVLYARVRWFEVFTDRTPGLSPTARVVAVAGTLLALCAATLEMAEALRPSPVVPSEIALSAVKAAFALGAAGAIWAMQPVGRRPFRWPMLIAWTGAGGMFAWGFWSLVNRIFDTPLVQESGVREWVGASAQLLGGALLAAVLVGAMRRVTGAAAPW